LSLPEDPGADVYAQNMFEVPSDDEPGLIVDISSADSGAPNCFFFILET
jgi:hypothetical protein